MGSCLFINPTEKLIMKSTLILLACFIGIASGAPRNDLQTPEYKVVKTFESDGEKFEERAYGVDMWVCTKQLITDITSDNGMFQKLFAYITGANDHQEKIEMTSPVSTMRQKSTKGEIHEQPQPPRELKDISMDELSKHNTEDDCWVAIF